MESLPIKELFRFSVLELGLAPSEFWRMTPRELAILCSETQEYMQKSDLLSLINKYPDKK